MRDGLNGHGVPSSGPIWPQHWAFHLTLQRFRSIRRSAANELAEAAIVCQAGWRGAPFKCLIPRDYERLALVIKRQLETVGVEMEIEEASLGPHMTGV